MASYPTVPESNNGLGLENLKQIISTENKTIPIPNVNARKQRRNRRSKTCKDDETNSDSLPQDLSRNNGKSKLENQASGNSRDRKHAEANENKGKAEKSNNNNNNTRSKGAKQSSNIFETKTISKKESSMTQEITNIESRKLKEERTNNISVKNGKTGNAQPKDKRNTAAQIQKSFIQSRNDKQFNQTPPRNIVNGNGARNKSSNSSRDSSQNVSRSPGQNSSRESSLGNDMNTGWEQARFSRSPGQNYGYDHSPHSNRDVGYHYNHDHGPNYGHKFRRDSGGREDPNSPNSWTPNSYFRRPIRNNSQEDELPPASLLKHLKQNDVHLLKKKNAKFPKAKYFCRLCEYHCDTADISLKHINDTRHKELEQVKMGMNTLKYVPEPTKPHLLKIDNLLEKVYKEHGFSDTDIKSRENVLQTLQDFLRVKVPEITLSMTGATVGGFALKSSPIEVHLNIPENMNASILLIIRDIIIQSTEYKNLVNHLSSRTPSITFVCAKTNLEINLGIYSDAFIQHNLLLKDYVSLDSRVLKLGVIFRYWAKLCNIDDPDCGSLPPFGLQLMLIHFLQQVSSPVLPVLHSIPSCIVSKDEDSCVFDLSKLSKSWKCENQMTIAELWVRLLRFYAVDYKTNSYCISIKTIHRNKPPAGGKQWGKNLFIKGPFYKRRNLAATISNKHAMQYIFDCFNISAKYFLIPQTRRGPLYKQISVNCLPDTQDDLSSEEEDEGDEEEEEECPSDEDNDDEETQEQDNASGQKSSKKKVIQTVQPFFSLDLSSHKEALDIRVDEQMSPLNIISVTTAVMLAKKIDSNLLEFKFEEKDMKKGRLPLFCPSCQKLGHWKRDCKEDELPSLLSLPPLTPFHVKELDHIFFCFKRDLEPRPDEIMERDRIVSQLQAFIRTSFNLASLTLFGSSANGFGFSGSDLDICLTFNGTDSGENLDQIAIITCLAEKLKTNRECSNVMSITTAKVPIVKFHMNRFNVEGDLSLYNELAKENTQLLATYAAIDPRVKELGYGMKFLAKQCDIGDASRGSLSSYAYTLMVLHFLQQVQPSPVIPVLQELYDPSKPRPENMIDSWNAWFYSDLKNLPKVWKQYGKNNMSVGLLWVSMLRYYTELFNWDEHVITIRQAKPLTRLEKQWTTGCIAIEDPFDLNHNLGGGLSRKMNTYIMKVFIKCRQVFGVSLREPPRGYNSIFTYLIDPDNLTDGYPPNDRGCRLCGRIGHFVKNCPIKVAQKERKERDRRKDTPAQNTKDAVGQHRKGDKDYKEQISGNNQVLNKENILINNRENTKGREQRSNKPVAQRNTNKNHLDIMHSKQEQQGINNTPGLEHLQNRELTKSIESASTPDKMNTNNAPQQLSVASVPSNEKRVISPTTLFNMANANGGAVMLPQFAGQQLPYMNMPLMMGSNNMPARVGPPLPIGNRNISVGSKNAPIGTPPRDSLPLPIGSSNRPPNELDNFRHSNMPNINSLSIAPPPGFDARNKTPHTLARPQGNAPPPPGFGAGVSQGTNPDFAISQSPGDKNFPMSQQSIGQHNFQDNSQSIVSQLLTNNLQLNQQKSGVQTLFPYYQQPSGFPQHQTNTNLDKQLSKVPLQNTSSFPVNQPLQGIVNPMSLLTQPLSNVSNSFMMNPLLHPSGITTGQSSPYHQSVSNMRVAAQPGQYPNSNNMRNDILSGPLSSLPHPELAVRRPTTLTESEQQFFSSLGQTNFSASEAIPIQKATFGNVPQMHQSAPGL